MSPLQFQKQIRLQEARRLMLGENLDVASAGFRVGYEDAAYFSRDYKKLFGAPPQRDIAQLRHKFSEFIKPDFVFFSPSSLLLKKILLYCSR